ncbi:unnamed protein product [Meloidogyne enterolobii]|uniref:Uncharacterized protein n=1 Tax=Meloidogyne enterolobii TaxID=390850 RepID=A0ACB0ZII7_MELEN
MYLIALSGIIFSLSILIPNLFLHSIINSSSFSRLSICFGNPLECIFMLINSATYSLKSSPSHLS